MSSDKNRDIEAAKLNILSARKELKKAREDLKALKNQDTIQRQLDAWKHITQIAEAANKQIIDYLNEENLKGKLGIPVSKARLEPAFKPYYTYVHPTKPSSQYRTNDKEARWIQNYIANGGNLATLIEKQQETIRKSFASAFKTKKKRSARKKSTPSSSNKKLSYSGKVDKSSLIT